MPTVALATCREFATLDADDRLIVPALGAHGIDAVAVVWNDPAVDWAAFDAVVIRETWDYSEVVDDFRAWTTRVSGVTRLLNPADVVAWNTDKHYLGDLAAAGVRVVDTRFLEPGQEPSGWIPDRGHDHMVIKPAISCGSRDTVRYDVLEDLDPATQHVRRLLGAGRSVMVQPYLDDVDTDGETALMFINGAFSHAIRKGPLLAPGVEGARVEGLFVQEQIDPRTPTADELALAKQALAAVPGGAECLLYARVDLIPADGMPVLLELELTEPSLFLAHADGAAARLAAAIARRV